MSKIAVAGATGRLGRHVDDVVTERGHEVVRISRTTGVDVITGDGLAAALDGVDVIIDSASWPGPDEKAAAEFFRTSTRNLHEAGRRAGVERVVVVSIIGIDSFSAGFLAAKRVHEEVSRTAALPVRILRAAQFHEFVGQLLDWQPGDVAYVPTWPTQLVAARTVAEALVTLATDPEAPDARTSDGPIPEIAGPREETMAAAAKLLGDRRGIQVVGADDPDDPDAAAYAGGALLPGPHATLTGPSYEGWLRQQD